MNIYVYCEERKQPGEQARNPGKSAGNLGEYAESIAMNVNNRDPGNHCPEDLVEKPDLEKLN